MGLLSRRTTRLPCGFVELAVEPAGDVALQAALDLSVGLALGASSFGVAAGGGVEAVDDDDVQGAVELAITAAVEPVAQGQA